MVCCCFVDAQIFPSQTVCILADIYDIPSMGELAIEKNYISAYPDNHSDFIKSL